MRRFFFILLLFFTTAVLAKQNVLNIYGWSGIIPDDVIKQFEKEYGIKVNVTTYDNNEILYAKLKASKTPMYDLIQPSSYYLDRIRRQGLLEPLDKSRLPNFRNIDPQFLNASYDPGNQYGVPFDWGLTGIFINKNYFDPNTIKHWNDLWNPEFKDQLMLLDDSREVFSMALISLGYSPNDTDPNHVREAFLKLKALMPNVKIFNSDAVLSIIIDDDAVAGMAWNGNAYKSALENPNVVFIIPKEGFTIWVDCFAIPHNAPHRDNAYQFLNFVLRPDISAKISLENNFPITNLAAKKLLPKAIQQNPLIFPSPDVLKHGHYQLDISDSALELVESYWEKLKIGG